MGEEDQDNMTWICLGSAGTGRGRGKLRGSSSATETETWNPKPRMQYTEEYNRLVEMMPDLPKLQEKRITDRQGLLVGKARLLGTFDQLRTCPYNESHRVGEGRFHQHLFKCREANPEKAALITICSYDASHHVPAELYQKHLTYCWARNEQTAFRGRQEYPVLMKPRVECLIRIFGSYIGGAPGSESKKEELIVETGNIPQNFQIEKATFHGPAMQKPTTYTSWY